MSNNQNDTTFGASSGGSSPKGGPSNEQGYIDRGGPLPEGYGDTLIVLLPRDPQWIFAYWEISVKTRDEITKKYGANIFQKAKPAIRVYDVTNVHFDGRNANRTFDIFITPESKNWYIYVGMPKRSYCADLGLLIDDGVFITLARSNVVATPAGSVSDIYDEQWMLVKEDFEKAYNILNQKEYPLSFYEYSLKHENYLSSNGGPKLIGAFQDNSCIGTISYKLTPCPHLGKILEIKEIYQANIKGHKVLIDFMDKLALDENCQAIKICKNQAERMNQNIFDRLENFLKKLCSSSFLRNSTKH
jgi:hypothetical protein